MGEICLVQVKLDGNVIIKSEFNGITFAAVNINTKLPVVFTVFGSKVADIVE